MSEIREMVIEQLQQLQMLMHRVSFLAFMDEGRAHNPHRGQGRVLAILKIKPEISQRDLTYLLGLSKQSIAELLTKLEKNGYITRVQSEDDKRVVTVKLTEEGRKAADGVDDSIFESSKILDCLDDEELKVFSGYLMRIIERYEEQFPEEDFEQRRKSMEEFMLRYGRGRGFEGHERFEGFGGFGGFGDHETGDAGEHSGRHGGGFGVFGRNRDHRGGWRKD